MSPRGPVSPFTHFTPKWILVCWNIMTWCNANLHSWVNRAGGNVSLKQSARDKICRTKRSCNQQYANWTVPGEEPRLQKEKGGVCQNWENSAHDKWGINILKTAANWVLVNKHTAAQVVTTCQEGTYYSIHFFPRELSETVVMTELTEGWVEFQFSS